MARDIVLELIAAGADINLRNSVGETPVYYAVRTGTNSVVRSHSAASKITITKTTIFLN